MKKSLLNKLSIGMKVSIHVANSYTKMLGWFGGSAMEYTITHISRSKIIGEIIIDENPLRKQGIIVTRDEIDCKRMSILV